MRYFLKSRYVVQVVLVLLFVSGLLGLWQGTLLYLPLPDFIPTLARSIPADAVLVACAVTAIALAAYPTTRIWEQVAPRGVLTYSHLLAVSLGLFACLTFSAVCLWGASKRAGTGETARATRFSFDTLPAPWALCEPSSS